VTNALGEGSARDPELRSTAPNDIAVELLLAGNFAGALEILRLAIRAGPATLLLWLNVAAAYRGLRRSNEEMEALKQALALDPRNLRALLQMASL